MPAFTHCGASGGFGGSAFTDGQVFDREIAEVRVHAGAFVDAIQLVYRDKTGTQYLADKHGGSGGNQQTLTLSPGEYVVEINGKHGWYIDRLIVKTSKGQHIACGGKGGAHTFAYAAPPGTSINGFWGRCGKYLDAIGVLLLSQ
jgi:hypothetical protein